MNTLIKCSIQKPESFLDLGGYKNAKINHTRVCCLHLIHLAPFKISTQSYMTNIT